jgi:hypothetical protein
MGRRTRANLLNALANAKNPVIGMKASEVSEVTGDLPITLCAHFTTLLRKRLIQARWEDEDFPGETGAAKPVASDQPRERYYRLTPQTNESSQ